MAGSKQPIDLLLAKGKKHLTKKEIEDRKASEVGVLEGEIEAPPYLTKKQQKEFDNIASQLLKLKIMSQTDIDALARYIISKDLYITLTKQLRKSEILKNPVLLEKYMKNQDKAFKQCRVSATDLGLTISSRCKLVVPVVEEKPKENKFNRFKRETG